MPWLATAVRGLQGGLPGYSLRQQGPGFLFVINPVAVDYLAAHQVELLNFEGCCAKIGVPLEVLLHCFISGVVHSCDGDVWMVDSLFRFNADVEEGVVDPLVQLEQARMGTGDSCPDCMRFPLGWKAAEAFDRQQELVDLNRIDRCLDLALKLAGDVPDKFQRQVEAFAGNIVEPLHLVFGQGFQAVLHIIRDVDRQKQPLSPEGRTGPV